ERRLNSYTDRGLRPAADRSARWPGEKRDLRNVFNRRELATDGAAEHDPFHHFLLGMPRSRACSALTRCSPPPSKNARASPQELVPSTFFPWTNGNPAAGCPIGPRGLLNCRSCSTARFSVIVIPQTGRPP